MDYHLELLIRKAAQILVSYGAKEVYLFGSHASGEADAVSDVDIAVRGLSDDVFFRAYAQASLGFPKEMDLVSLDDSNPFTDFLLREGPLVRII